MTWQEIMNSAINNYTRNSALSKQRLAAILQDTYTDLLAAGEWQAVKDTVEIPINSAVVDGERFELPENFKRIDEGADFIVDNDTDNIIMIISKQEVTNYTDPDNRDNLIGYYSVLRDGGKKYLVFHFGERPQNVINFTGIFNAEEIVDLNEEPKYVWDEYHNLLVYGLARDIMIAKNIDRTEQITLAEIKDKYNLRMAQYKEENNEVTYGA